MKILIITQVIDTEHPILGFFHRWVEEFASQCEHVHVICLEAGKHSLPANVTVHSLGKEEGKGRLVYLVRFYKLIWSLRHEYSNVFIHMNQLYVTLGFLPWMILRKNVGLWYAHGTTSLSLRLAILLTGRVFTSTEEGLQINTNKKIIVGQGLDTNLFKLGTKQISEQIRLITVGRIAKSKNIATLLEASSLLKKQGFNFRLTIIGIAITPEEISYETEMKKLTHDLNLEKEVQWVGSVPNYNLPEALQQSDIFVHDGATNSLDKTLIEAALCGCVVVSSNPAYTSVTKEIAPEYLYSPKDSQKLANIVKNINQDHNGTEAVRMLFFSTYNIIGLVQRITKEY